MIFLLLSVLIVPYFLMWLNERKFVGKNTRQHGKCINVSHLSLLTVDGEDQLIWGSKVYLHEKSIIIAPPLASTMIIPYEDIQFPRVSNQLISFCFLTGDNSYRFNLLTSPTDNKISNNLIELFSNNNCGVITC